MRFCKGSLAKGVLLLTLISGEGDEGGYLRWGALGLGPLPDPNETTTFVLRIQKAGSTGLEHGFRELWQNDEAHDLWPRLNKDPLFGILRCTMRSGRTPAEASLLTQECGGIRATKGIAREIADLPKYMSGMYSYALP